MAERWRPVPSFPLYEASSLGRIRSPYRLRKLAHDDDGYLVVDLYKGGSRVKMRVNRLVCEAFHGLKPAWAADAAHNNGIKTINRPENLRWSTRRGNAADRRKHGTQIEGEKHHAALFTPGQIKTIRAQYAASPKRGTIPRLARAFDVTSLTIRNIVNRKSWKHI